MSVGHDEFARDPFREFIVQHLDLSGIDVFNTYQLAEQIRALFADWLADDAELMPSDYMDELQEHIVNTLTPLIAESPLVYRSELAHADPGALQWVIRQAVMMAFALHSEMGDRIMANEQHQMDDDYTDARRLRRMLMITLVYARRAALESADPVAQRIVDDADALIDSTERLR
ncbi:MAG: hypothetical protein SF162_05980 [bacterium]|nr:hypothetical protein [bacterium]